MKKAKDEIILQIIFIVMVVGYALACILPFLMILSASFSSERSIIHEGYKLIPTDFTVEAYSLIFTEGNQVLVSYMVTILVTVCGTLLSLIMMSLLAYPLSRKYFKLRNVINFYIYFTMLFSGGLVPTYILIAKWLRLEDSILALILPYLVMVWYVFLLRNFFSSIPESLEESAKLDGASVFQVFYKIMLPLSKPAIATIGLFMSLIYWNDWWLAMLYINKANVTPLQLMLQKILLSAQFYNMNQSLANQMRENIPTENLKMALIIVATGPIILAYPFFQKYFVRGLKLGAVKG